MEVLAKRAITPRVSGIPGTPFVSILLATYRVPPPANIALLTLLFYTSLSIRRYASSFWSG